MAKIDSRSLYCMCRFHHAPPVPFAFASSLRVGRRDAVPVPRARLVRPARAEGPQRKSQLSRGAPVGQGRVERREGQDAENVGFHARQGCGEHQAGERCVMLLCKPHVMTLVLMAFVCRGRSRAVVDRRHAFHCAICF